MSRNEIEEKLEILKKIVESDLQAADALISIFTSAGRSWQKDSLLVPYPKPYMNDDGTKNTEELISHLDEFPSLDEFLVLLMANNTSLTIPSSSINLIHYIFLSTKARFSIESVPKSKYDSIISLPGSSPGKISAKPNFIFKVNYADCAIETKFSEYAKIMSTKFAFHGTRFSNIFSILNFGLQQHLNKNGLFGEGLYLAQEIDISLLFSPSVASWDNSKLGNTMSCIAICEYIDDPIHVKVRKENAKNSDIPQSYLLITNNEIVRVRYLMLYGRKSTTTKKKKLNDERINEINDDNNLHQSRSFRIAKWCRKNPFILSVLLYVMLLFLVGLSNSRLVEYYKNNVMNFLRNRFKYL